MIDLSTFVKDFLRNFGVIIFSNSIYLFLIWTNYISIKSNKLLNHCKVSLSLFDEHIILGALIFMVLFR